jgi:extradiol dioxygenase family protein
MNSNDAAAGAAAAYAAAPGTAAAPGAAPAYAAAAYAAAPGAAAAEPLTPFHIAIQVRDIAEARAFYKDILGCAEGRSDIEWVDFNLFGHQLVCHLNPALGAQGSLAGHFNQVDGHGVPVPHCGVVLRPAQWSALAERLRRLGVQFIIEPCTRFRGQVGEQSTMFFRDPSGNALEFKAFRDLGQLFATAAPPAVGQ